MRKTFSALALVALASGCGMFGHKKDQPAPATSARATMRDAQGQSLGDITLMQTAQGVLITGLLTGVPEGTHAFHVHTVGRCTPSFDAAGGHFNPTARQHGIRNPAGMHAGDLPNVSVTGGTVRLEFFTTAFTLGTSGTGLLDADGSALMLHALTDDYTTDPSGSAGARIACGVIQR